MSEAVRATNSYYNSYFDNVQIANCAMYMTPKWQPDLVFTVNCDVNIFYPNFMYLPPCKLIIKHLPNCKCRKYEQRN